MKHLDRKLDKSVFFPWERKRGLLSRALRARFRWVVALGVLGIALALVRGRMERIAAERATRARIGDTIEAVRAYRATHRGACPKEVADLTSNRLLAHRGTDAWGKPLRIVCPGRRDPTGFDVVSDGPDGIAFGLDRIQ
jgi:general secretion pathway protein G